MAKDNQFVKDIADIETDFPQWYTDVVLKTKLVDYGPVKGTMVIRPYGYAIWENIQRELDKRFRATGHQNAYFPMLIPESYLKKEAEHVEGFAPEVAVVTHAGGEKLAEPLVIRPTSETIIGEMYSKWLQSYRDLPILVNQWANVVRWEKTTRPFLRTSEFLWQEGHTVHATEEEAMEETMKMLGVYKEFAESCLAIPVFTGRKTEKEKFAGAVATFGMEAMMHDGKSLQAGTSHYLGQNFAKAFDIQFLDKDGTHKYGYTTSWGVSTRLIGALIMAHGDQRGLVLPPVVAPVQAILIPIAAKKEGVLEAVAALKERLAAADIRVDSDVSDNSPGWKFNEWEMKGVPLRIELGPRDIEAGKMVLVRRDTHEKIEADLCNAETVVKELLAKIQKNLYELAKQNKERRVVTATNMDEILAGVENGNFVKAGWCGCRECEDKIKEKTAASSRVIAEGETAETCACCGKKAEKVVYFARAY
ncbi:proline--tRNA ligase [Candidatus Borkfalkia ceftriaxoniphila]|uniref:Proline--tRNA ligase n=1 Tax=Candidatus Borkfalkia ceftriaxoniphila TaxID=2508949 RepID=A0A4Q2KES8_9FIRM|nr:proline--tRNA ligase [Candidatus Borkfalkia ceftriaxoniphila]RXZ62400.1 proline--tRNA ligase [Candidatus Borkfalkia ceftriaxoniphila]